MHIRAAQMVPIEILQDDMVGFEGKLPFPPVPNLYGKTLLTEKVIWGEIWFADRSKRGMWHSGYVKDGALYIIQTAREKFNYNRKHDRQIPTLMPLGTYKVWLDAWIRMGDYIYESDPPFTTEPVNGKQKRWNPPDLPARKYWQEVKITAPAQRGDPCRLRLRSRRFHWIYRLSRIIDALDRLLLSHEKLVANVAKARNLAQYLRQFLSVLYESGYNMNHIHIEDPSDDNSKYFCDMQIRLLSTFNACSNFINYGVCLESQAPIPERKHINNLASLVWNLIHNSAFGKEVAHYDPVFAEEHRVLLSRLGFIFNRIPKVFTSVSPVDQYQVRVTGESFDYGRAFACEFTFPFFEKKFGDAGKFPLAKGLSSKPASTVDAINSARRYTISMLNAASIFVSKENISYKKMSDIVGKQIKVWDELWGVAGKEDDLVLLCDEYIEKYKQAGNSDWVRKVLGNRDLLQRDATRAMAASDPDLAKIQEEFRVETEKLEKGIEYKRRKALDVFKESDPAFAGSVQAIEIFVKWAVFVSAWNAFREGAGHASDDPWWIGKGMKAVLKGLDAGGATLQFIGLHKILRAVWLSGAAGDAAGTAAKVTARLETLSKVGKGMGAMADVGSAIVFSYDIFVTHTYGDELLEKYPREDAVSVYGFHLVTWAGKWLVGVGSSGGVFSKLPIFAALQGVGYLSQLIGEFGEAMAAYGAGEHKHFHDVHEELLTTASQVASDVRSRGWPAEFYPRESMEKVREAANNFKWRPVDPKLFNARLAPPVEDGD
jgi:hypothetical protein